MAVAKFQIDRRQLLGMGSGLAIVVATGLPASAQQQELVVVATGGAFEKALRQYFYDPFTKATGVTIRSVAASNAETWTKLRAMQQAGGVQWDIVTAYPEDLVAQADSLAPIDCGKIANLAEQAVAGACQDRGLLRTIGGVNIVYDKSKFPNGGPQNWAEFWDLKKFPGPRSMPNAGAPWWALMAALMADGVPSDKLFPLDLDRAFKKMDQIRPSVGAFWRSGDQAMQLLRSGEVNLSMMWSGSAFVMQKEGMPLDVIWNQAVPNIAYWSIVKGSTKVDLAMKFLDFFLTRPESHLAFSEEFKYDTSNRNLLGLIPEADRKQRGSTPENQALLAKFDPAWVAANRAAVIERWNQWVAS